MRLIRFGGQYLFLLCGCFGKTGITTISMMSGLTLLKTMFIGSLYNWMVMALGSLDFHSFLDVISHLNFRM